MAQYDVDLRDYWRIFKKRKTVVILSIFLMAISSYGFTQFLEPDPLYEASSSVKIEQENNLGSMLLGFLSWGMDDSIATQAAIVKSFPVLAQAAKKMGWIPQSASDIEVRTVPEYLSRIERLKQMVKTKREDQTSIININVISSDAREAARIANIVAQAYREFNIKERNRQTSETGDFIKKQLKVTSKDLATAEKRLRVFKEKNELMILEAAAAKLLSRINSGEVEYQRVRSLRRNKEIELRHVMEIGDSTEDLTATFYAEDPQSLLRDLTGKLSALSARKKSLLLSFTPAHPQIREIENQINGIFSEVQQELVSQINMFKNRERNLLDNISQLKLNNSALPEKALQLSRLEREVSLNQTLHTELKTKHQETLIQEAGRIEEVTIIRPAMVSTVPVNRPSRLIASGAGIVIGIMLGFVVAFVMETLDTSIGTIEDVEEFLQLPVLGVIPFTGNKDVPGFINGENFSYGSLVTHFEPKSIAAESYRSLRTNLQFIELKNKGNIFLVTSSALQEGKTFNTVNLALSMAQAGDSVLLVEADLRRPSVYKILGLDKDPGLTDFVLGNYQWREVANSIIDLMLGEFDLKDILHTPGLDNLYIMTAGSTPPNPTEILRSPRFEQFLEEASKEYDVILIDAPPILPVADTSVIAPQVDGIIMVYEVGKIARGLLKRAKLTLDNVQANMLGIILNNVKPEVTPDFYNYHYMHPGTNVNKDDYKDPKENRFGGFIPYLVIAAVILFLIIGAFWSNLTDLFVHNGAGKSEVGSIYEPGGGPDGQQPEVETKQKIIKKPAN